VSKWDRPTYEIVGYIIDAKQVSKSMILRWYEYIIKTEDRYPQTLLFRFKKYPQCRLAPYSKGDKVKVMFEINGWEKEGSYYVGLKGLSLERIGKPAQWVK